MKTSFAKNYAEAFDAHALEQIRDWARISAQACKNESQRLFKEHHAMAVVMDAIHDQTEFECLATSLDDILKGLK